MAKKIRNIDDLLEWDEIVNFILPEPISWFSLSLDSFQYLGESFREQAEIREDVYRRAKSFYEQSLPNCPIPFNPDFFWVTIRPIEQYKNKLCFSVAPFFYEFLKYNDGFIYGGNCIFLEPGLQKKILPRDELCELLKKAIRKKRELLRSYEDGDIILIPDREQLKSRSLQEAIFAEVRQCNWLIKNLDLVIDFLNTKLPSDLFTSIGKDRVLAYLAFSSSHLLNLFEPLPEGATYEKVIEPTENYLLLVNYLESIIGRKYKVRFSTYTDFFQDGVIKSKGIVSFSVDDFRTFQKEFYHDYPDIEKREGRPKSYEEILKTRATSTWERIQREKLLKQIKVNWELLPQKKSLSEGIPNTIDMKKDKKTSSEKRDQMKKDYDVLDRKLSFFESTNPLCILSGIHTFVGYQAYVYANRMVVFEKFYQERGKDVYPARESAIYIMNFEEFAELSKYSRPELIQQIRDFNNKDVMRVCHSGNWEERVKNLIQGIGYGDLELSYIEELTRSLSTGTVDKVKEKEL